MRLAAVPLPLIAAHALWLAWGLSWIAAGAWHGAKVATAPAAGTRRWLLVAGIGFTGLFGEAPDRLRPLWHAPAAVDWALVALVGAGLALAWWARIVLGRLWSGGIVAREGHRIVDTGPYALVRHPIYTALFLGAAGLALLKATPFALAGFVVIVIGFWGKARVEERFLATEVGDYAAYARRVPMLVPFA